jgi:hypothetical protein
MVKAEKKNRGVEYRRAEGIYREYPDSLPVSGVLSKRAMHPHARARIVAAGGAEANQAANLAYFSRWSMQSRRIADDHLSWRLN